MTHLTARQQLLATIFPRQPDSVHPALGGRHHEVLSQKLEMEVDGKLLLLQTR